ncbi:MAG: phenylalanine--tRNA ligase subunit beta [candidate division Zixibacteria bacterium]|nr:phenylalanine--tRNA ligase subunit beta [candidate division Zixibacteria bacterium]
MKISYQWLKELTGLDWSVEEMAERLTLSGTACEDIESTARHMNNVVVGEVLEVTAVEGADRIRATRVNVGSEELAIICGAPNVAVGQKVAVALIGAELAGGLKIKETKIRGIESSGMICAEDELGLSQDHAGIMVLDADATVGRPLAEHLDFDDYVMEFELTPNRADSVCAIGIARDLAALAGTKIKYPTWDLKTSPDKAADVVKVSIDDPDACARFTARVIRKVKVGPSPWWLRKKLITAGIRPISNIVDISNLVMLEYGNPMHAFDLDTFGSHEVVIRRARKGEKLTTLDEKEHDLTEDVLLITNGKTAVSAAGVMGGLDSEVSDTTTNVMLEVAYFDPRVIRRSRKHLGFVTESSTRFEKGVDPNRVAEASARAAFLIQELCGGEVLEGMVDCYPRKIDPVTVSLRPARCNTILGTTIPVERQVELLNGLEFEVRAGETLEVTIPTFRPDITHEIDLIEEVGRLIGYAAIPDATENKGPLFTPAHEIDLFEAQVRDVLTAAGFDEMLGHGLAQSAVAETVSPGVPQLRIVNPVSEDLDIMRNSLIQTALGVIKHNISHRCLGLRLFEIGKAYFPPNTNGEWIEEDRLLLTVTGDSDTNWRQRPRPQDFYDISGALTALASHFRWPTLRFEPAEFSHLDDTVSFRLLAGDQEIGWVGQIDPPLARKMDIKQPVFAAEFAVGSLMGLREGRISFVPLPVYPAAPRDLALVVDESVEVGDIVATVRRAAGKLAESVELFDLYIGKQIGKGRKSVGVAITYRAADRSLQSDEVDKLQDQVVARLTKQFNAEIRDK